MAKKGKLWSKLFTHRDEEDKPGVSGEPGVSGAGGDDVKDEIRGLELPKEPCHFCYEPFAYKDMAYKCNNCNTLYHHPDCVRSQSSCRVCGENIVETGNLFRLLKLRSVICPKCGMKVKLFFSNSPKLDITCPSCSHEGHLPNPYLKDLNPEPEKKAESEFEITEGEIKPDEDEDEIMGDDELSEHEGGEEEEMDEDEEDLEVWEEGELEEIEDVVEAEEVTSEIGGVTEVASGSEVEVLVETEAEAELLEEEGPKVVKPDKSKRRKAKLVTLEQSLTCNVCLSNIKSGKPVVVCKCGKKYHESCATNIGECPTCDGNLRDFERLIDEELVEEHEPEPEPEPEVKLELGTELDSELTFDKFKGNDNNKILQSITLGIAEAPGLEFRLTYIFGPVNKGKTHLLQAIGNHIRQNKSDLSVKYTNADKFVSELAQAIELGKRDEFELFYHQTDVLLFDDFSQLPMSKANQDAFFSIFDELLGNNKQIVLTGDTPIDEIKNLGKGSVKKIISLSGIIINLSVQ